MSKIILAETAGFCFGVKRAVEMVYELVENGEKVCTLGPIIHNPQLVADLEAKGVRIVDSPNDVKSGEILVLRSHGVAKETTDLADNLELDYRDATCPFVAKIHKIVKEAGEQGRTVLIAGDKDHKEVEGIVGHCTGKYFVFKDENELCELQKSGKITADEPITLVEQTTFNKKIWEKCQKNFKKLYTNGIIFVTICNATAKRQQEAIELSLKCDAMIVIGGKQSSNTKKLFEVCKQNCNRTVHIETSGELKKEDFCNAETIGVVAGASTPAGIIKEVIKTMTETIQLNDEMSFEEMLDASMSDSNTDQKVKGYVMSVNPTEIQVDIGRKHAGFVSAEEFSNDPSVKLTEAVKVGDVLDLIIMKTNDQEGTVQLSKKRYDAIAGWQKIEEAKESGEIIEGVVSAIIKGGITVFYEGMRVFIPASHATLTRGEDLEALKGQTVKFRIIETGRGRRAIGSIRSVLREEKKAETEQFWANIAVGDKFNGTVKSLTGYGAFVDLGGVDGMVHISELSWARIKNPSEVVAVGDKIDVYVKDIDTEKRKISLGYKKADENPWVILQNKYSVDDIVDVTVVSLTSYGAFARIIPGVDGLIHISQIADRRISKPADELKIGEEVKAKIIDIDFENKRVSLSIRALIEKEEAEAEEEAKELLAEQAEEAPAEVVEQTTVEEATEEAAE